MKRMISSYSVGSEASQSIRTDMAWKKSPLATGSESHDSYSENLKEEILAAHSVLKEVER